jgi:hypothetical protein
MQYEECRITARDDDDLKNLILKLHVPNHRAISHLILARLAVYIGTLSTLSKFVDK